MEQAITRVVARIASPADILRGASRIPSPIAGRASTKLESTDFDLLVDVIKSKTKFIFCFTASAKYSTMKQGHPTTILGKYLFGRRFEI